MKFKATIVFERNWSAIHKKCETCSGSGVVELNSCSWCGDGETLNAQRSNKGSGRHYKYIINKGSSRSSKTVSLNDCYYFYAYQNPNKRLTVWRDTKKSCKDTVLRDALKHFKATGRHNLHYTYNKTESYFEFTNGSVIEMNGTDDELKVHGYEQDSAWMNEPYKIRRETFNQIDMRTSDFFFIDYNPKLGHWVDDLATHKRAIVIHSTYKLNPFCPPEQKNKIEGYQPISMCSLVIDKKLSIGEAFNYDVADNKEGYTPKEVRELARCQENEKVGSANPNDWRVYGLGEKGERPNRIFFWNKVKDIVFDELKDVPELIVVDWGKVDPWGIAHLKYYDGTIYAKELNYESENEIRAKLSLSERKMIDSEEEGIVTFMFNKLGISKKSKIIADNNRLRKIAMLRRGGWQADPARKGSGSVMDGIDLLHDLKVCYTESSVNIEMEQEEYSYDNDRMGVLDKPEDANNHLIDPIRYGVTYWQSMGVIKKV